MARRYKLEICLLLILIFLSFFVRALPYLIYNYDYLIGFDTGIYQYLFTKYVNSESWPIYFSYPPLKSYEISLSIWMEPGFFALNSIINKLIGLSTTSFFMYYLPFEISLIFIFLIYTIVRNLTQSSLVGFITCFLWVASPLESGLINESFYKQTMGIFVLLITIYSLQKFERTGKNAYLACATLFSSSMIIYHRTELLLLGFVYLYYIIIKIQSKEFRIIKLLLISGFLTFGISSIVWLNQLDWNLMIIKDAINMSLNPGTSLGGNIPISLRGSSNLMIDYLLNAPIILFFFIIASLDFIKSFKLTNLFFISTIFIIFLILSRAIAYNRLIYNLDVMLLIVASIGFSKFKNRLFRKNIYGILIIILIIIFSIFNIISIQKERAPYIPYKNENFEWIHNNIDANKSIIFTSDWLSTVLKSEGYRVAYYEDLFEDPHYTYVVAKNENFEVLYNGNFSNIQKYNLFTIDTAYFIWSKWDETHPFYQLNKTINPKIYENNQEMKKVYDEDIKVYMYKLSR